MPRRTPAQDYRSKTDHELSAVKRGLERAGHPLPLGDPLSGVMLVVDSPTGPRLLDALRNSLDAINAPEAYATWTDSHSLHTELLIADPSVLVAVGPEAATRIDGFDHPLAITQYSEAATGRPFPWKRSTTGLLIPPLAPALDDEVAKKTFWKAFLTLRRLLPDPR